MMVEITPFSVRFLIVHRHTLKNPSIYSCDKQSPRNTLHIIQRGAPVLIIFTSINNDEFPSKVSNCSLNCNMCGCIVSGLVPMGQSRWFVKNPFRNTSIVFVIFRGFQLGFPVPFCLQIYWYSLDYMYISVCIMGASFNHNVKHCSYL